MMRTGNNFGFLRVLFAILVIVSHSPQILDGNTSREFGTQYLGFGLGGLAVSGFFLISGYLITKSFETSNGVGSYLTKRILRIYPGFVVAYLISLIVVGSLAGGNLAEMGWADWLTQPLRIVLLRSPQLDGAFASLPYPMINGSMWTIAYEFCCYLLVIALGVSGAIKTRWLYLGVTIMALMAVFLIDPVAEQLNNGLRFLSIFLLGGAYYLFRDVIVFDGKIAAAASLLLLITFFVPALYPIGLYAFGSYLMFWFAFNGTRSLNSIGGTVDLSYGVYLYAWPVQSLLALYDPTINPWEMTFFAIVISVALAFVSWTFVERPFLRLKPVGWLRQNTEAQAGVAGGC